MTKLSRITVQMDTELNPRSRADKKKVTMVTPLTKLNKDAMQRGTEPNQQCRAAWPEAPGEKPRTKLNSSNSATLHNMLDSAPLYRGLPQGTLVFQLILCQY